MNIHKNTINHKISNYKISKIKKCMLAISHFNTTNSFYLFLGLCDLSFIQRDLAFLHTD